MMAQSASAPDIGVMFGDMFSAGQLSQQAFNALAAPDLTARIQGQMGMATIDAVRNSAEAVLLAQLPDDSGSVAAAGNEPHIINGHNLVLDSVSGAKHRDDVMAMTRYLNGKMLFSWRPIDQAVRMSTTNYQANGGTPLYDETVGMLAMVLAKWKESFDAGLPCRTITLIVTDGNDEHSRTHRPATVEPIVKSMLAEGQHIIAFMGIDDHGHTDFRAVATSMGIPAQWILTPANDPRSIRAAFLTFSQSAQRASQNRAGFSTTAAGGFGV